MDDTKIGHLHTHSNVIRDSPAEKAKALWVAGKLGTYWSCDRCGKIVIKIIEVGNENICQVCRKKIPKLDKIKRKLTAHRRQLITDRIRNTTQNHGRHPSEAPPPMGKCVHSVLDRHASARTDEDAFNALEAWAQGESRPSNACKRRKTEEGVVGENPSAYDDSVAGRGHRRMLERRTTHGRSKKISQEK